MREVFWTASSVAVEKNDRPCYNYTMNVRFAPEAAKREMTPVDNLFFTTYMPEADGMFVKVYLYGLMQCYHTALQDEEISDALDISETDVRTAFVYWQAKGLVRIDSEEPFVVEYMLADLPSLTTATDLKYRPFVRALQAVFAPRRLELRELRAMYDCIEVYGLEEDAVLELAAYCREQKGSRVSANYIRAAAKSWNERGVVTGEQARIYVADYRARLHGATEVLLRWNKHRPPTVDEMALYEKWTQEWGFDEEAILAVCPQLVEVLTPSFAILNDRLEAMRDKQLSTADSIRTEELQQLDDRAFTKTVFARLGKVEAPSRTDVAQMAMFRHEKDIPENVILLAAETCRTAERPYGVLKKILLRFAEQGIRTEEDAKQALETKPAMRPKKRFNRAVDGYEQHAFTNADVEHMIVNLDEDV